MATVLQALRHAARSLLRAPGHTTLVVATLAVGIAASTTVFSVMNPYLLRPLPFGEADRLIQIEQVETARGNRWVRFSLPMWTDWQAGARSLEDLAAYRYTGANLTGEGEAARLMVSWTTPNIFDVLDVPALHGRTFGPDDGGPGAAPVVVLSHGLWATRFGGDPGVVGRAIRLDGTEHTVLGIMPRDFTFPWNEVKAWVPERSAGAWSDRSRQSFILIGRLADGWTADQAEGDLLRVQRELGEQHPDADGRYLGLNIRELREALNFGYHVIRIGFVLLLGAVGVLLLIACVNVAGLMLARATGRRHELAIRRAIGAGRARLAGQLLGESALLALAGGLVGFAGAWLLTGLLAPRLPEGLFRVGTASLDGRVVLFAVAVTMITPFLFGLSPALGAARTAPADVLRSGAAGGDRRGIRRRKALVVVQVGLAVLLAAMTSLLGRSFLAVQELDTGFAPATVLIAEATPPVAEFEDPADVDAFFDRAAAALAGVTGVVAVGQADRLPLNHETAETPYRGTGAEGVAADGPLAIWSAVSPGYFEATGTPLLQGRGFLAADGPESGPVVVVSRALAHREWPGGTAVGRTLRFGEGNDAVEATVIGVAGDVRWVDLTSPPLPHIYRPLSQSTARRRFLVAGATTAAAAAALAAPVRQTLGEVAPTVPLAVRPMTDILRENDFQWAISSMAVGLFGAIALGLAMLGIYGLMAYSVALRRRELGIRAALGARAASIRGMVVRQGLRLTAIGLLGGVALAIVAGRLLSSLLFGVRATDPLTFAGVAILFLAVAIAASAAPAARAARVQPAEVLRE